MSKVNTLIIRVAGTNCDVETAYAFKMAGAGNVDMVHINRLIEGTADLDKYHIMAIPGGTIQPF